jgi:hypothetical protein
MLHILAVPHDIARLQLWCVPFQAAALLDHNAKIGTTKINFRGFLVGNPYIDMAEKWVDNGVVPMCFRWGPVSSGRFPTASFDQRAHTKIWSSLSCPRCPARP